MKHFPEHAGLNLSDVNKEINEFWEENDVFHQSIEQREGAPSFVFYEGPPSANGMPGIHHVMSRTIKDIFCRYKTMQGFQVKRKAGWDTHGLPVELGVEKSLGITKEDIGKKISIEEYNAACRREVMKYTKEWEMLTRLMGYWVDMENPYITYDNKYIETLWWLLKQLYNKGLLYKGYTIQPYSPAAGTGLSSHELNQPGCYRDVKDRTAVAMFRLLTPLPPLHFREGEKMPIKTVEVKIPPQLLANARELRKNQTDAEEMLWELLRGRKLNDLKFRRQHPLSVGFILDFYCAEAKLGIEIDGGYHNKAEQKEYDKQRTEIINQYEINIIRFTNEDVINKTDKVLQEIANAAALPLYKMERGQGGEVYILAWTTTPWTLPSNTALCVGEKIDYVRVKTLNPYSFELINVILAKSLISSVLGNKYFEADKNSGDDLFLEYQQILKRKKEKEDIVIDAESKKLRIELITGKKLSLDEYDIIKTVILNPKDTEEKKIKTSLEMVNISYDKYQELVTYNLHLNDTLPYQILKEYKGADLVGLEYEQLIPYVKPNGKAFEIISGDFVTTEDGTGIVHIAPTFGADDDKVAKQSGIVPMLLIDKNGKQVPMVDLTGKFYKIEDLDADFVKNSINVELYKKYAGKFVKDAYYQQLPENHLSLDDEICIWLKEQNLLFKSEKHTHNYPHCWRTDKPVLYYPLDSWFIRSTACRDEMIALNNTINWKPQSTGTGRFGKWLENLNDWNLSRSRYWGTPLPIWRSEDGTEEICIGSVEELFAEIEKSVKAGLMSENPYKNFKVGDYSAENYSVENIDLHRPYVDGIILVSPSGKAMKREMDLIDVWFDSGAMPFAQVHYPFETE